MNCHREPTLNGILSDPIVKAVMEADGVNPHELEVMLRQVAQRLRIPSGQHQAGLNAAVLIQYSLRPVLRMTSARAQFLPILFSAPCRTV